MTTNCIIKFQFLIGTLKTQTTFSCQPPFPFQFLIGTLKPLRASGTNASSGVSIPHRYAKNLAGAGVERYIWQFQFLIGTLKTVFSIQTSYNMIRVSIPHRYAKNAVF